MAHLALVWPGQGRADQSHRDPVRDPVRRVSRLAQALVVVGVGTGAVNAGLILPAV